MEKIIKWFKGSPFVFYYSFRKPPYGGSNQFFLALYNELSKRDLDIGLNRITSNTRSCLLNSFNFDYDKFKKIKKKFPKLRIVHRIDGPISVYRGENNAKIDIELSAINKAISSATIFQSNYSLERHRAMGLEFNAPTVIPNAVNPQIFNSKNRIARPAGGRKIRLIATSWSDNPKKGGPFYKWLEGRLDWNKYDFTFIGRTKERFDKIKMIPACRSEKLAEYLRSHDIYISASQNESCSNAILEALNCGLPVVYIESGSNAELVKKGGIGFREKEDSLFAIDEVACNFEKYQKQIETISIQEVAERYLKILRS